MKASHVTMVLAAAAMLAAWSPAQSADSAPVSVMKAQPAQVMSLQRMPADMQVETREDDASRNHLMELALRISEVSLGQQQGCFVELAGLAGMRLNGVRLVADYDRGNSVVVLRGNMGSDGYYLLASSQDVGSADMVNPAVCFDNDLRRLSLKFGNVTLSSVDVPEGSMPGVVASCMSEEGQQWNVLSHASPGYENACDCIDFDGDGFGVGPGCRGPDCSDLLVNCNIDCRQDVDFDSIPDCFDECPLDPHKLTAANAVAACRMWTATTTDTSTVWTNARLTLKSIIPVCAVAACTTATAMATASRTASMNAPPMAGKSRQACVAAAWTIRIIIIMASPTASKAIQRQMRNRNRIPKIACPVGSTAAQPTPTHPSTTA